MTQEPFTAAGVQAKTTELYALSSTDLNTQVGLINSDFKSWISDNFILNSTQQTYLDGIGAQFMSYATSLTAFAVANKLDISLTFTGDTGFKLVHLSNSIVVTTSSSGFNVTGGLTYNVEYTG